MQNLEEARENRFRFLHHIYDKCGGDIREFSTIKEVAAELEIALADAIKIAQYLEGEGLVEVRWVMGGGGASPISITHWGVKQVEEALEKPEECTQYFPPVYNIIHVQQMYGSQIQQGTHTSTQTGTFNFADASDLAKDIPRIKEEFAKLEMTGDDRAEVNAEIQTLESQVKSSRPKRHILKESLETLFKIAERIGVPVLIEILKRYLPSVSP